MGNQELEIKNEREKMKSQKQEIMSEKLGMKNG